MIIPPLVSIIIPTRNRLLLLQRSIDSVNRQTLKNLEIIIVDNAAETPLKAEQLKSDIPLSIYRSEEMLLLPSSRNFGALHANGEFISFLDDDDEILPEKLARHMQAFKANPSLDFVFGNTRQVGPNGETIQISRGSADLVAFLRWRFIHTNALTIRKKVFDQLKYCPNMSTYEDVELIGRLMLSHQGQHVDEVHALWYRDNRPDQLTRRNYRRSYENWARLCEQFDEIICSDRSARRYYHRKMAILSMMFGDLRQFVYSALRIF